MLAALTDFFRRRGRLVVFSAVCLAVLCAAGCGKKAPPQPPDDDPQKFVWPKRW